MGEVEQKLRSSLKGALYTFFVDMFDVYLPVIVLAPAMPYFLPPKITPLVQFAIMYATLAATILGRPIGSIIFGRYADKLGRKESTIRATLFSFVFTLLIAILPGYAILGIIAISLLIALRFLVGLGLGGMYIGANTLVMELSPKDKRGPYGALIILGYPLAFATMSFISLPLLSVFPPTSPTSLYDVYIWRIPFIVEIILLLTVYFYYKRIVPESELWKVSKKEKSPLKELLIGKYARDFWQAFVLSTGIWMGFLTIVSSLPTISMKVVGISPVTSTLYLGIAALIWGACFYHWGLLSQKIGRKTILLISGILYLIGVPLYYLYINFGRFWGPIGIFLSILALFIISDTAFPILPAYLTERFVTSVRGSGYGIGYTWGLLIPSFNSFYILWLSRIMPPVYAMTLPLLFLGGILAIIGVLLGPETKDVDFTKII